MRLAWVTDVHLNFVDEATRRRFAEELADCCDAVIISGDIGESHDVTAYLLQLERVLQRPIYFVLGNHDFYGGSIAATRNAVTELARQSQHLVYLTIENAIPLTPSTALLGHDGWADARLGDFPNSTVVLNDYILIAELVHWDRSGKLMKSRLAKVLHALGDEAGEHLERTLGEAAGRFRHLIAATHVPPFREAAWYAGRTSDDDYLPHFACQAAGAALRRVMQKHPDSELLVLCGHTHGQGEVRVLENLQVITGEAIYGSPRIQRILEIE